jgi:hypothetical protein
MSLWSTKERTENADVHAATARPELAAALETIAVIVKTASPASVESFLKSCR